MESLSIIAIVSLIASIFAVALAIVTIWLSFYNKSETDKTNRDTQKILTDIKTDAKIISQYALPELQKYGDLMRYVVMKTPYQDDGNSSNKILEEIDQSFKAMRTAFEGIKRETDMKSIKTKVGKLEELISASKEDVKKTVQESMMDIVFYTPIGIYGTPIDQFQFFIDNLLDLQGFKNRGYTRENYKIKWIINHRISRDEIPPIVIHDPKKPFPKDLFKPPLGFNLFPQV